MNFLQQLNGAGRETGAKVNIKQYARKVGIEHIHLHQTRHTYARMVSEDTGSIIETQDALGHSNAATTRVQRIAVKRDRYSDGIAERLGV